jgi:beta-glucosidase
MPDRVTSNYDDARDRVSNGEDPALVAHDFVFGLAREEKLWCLDGDEEFWPGLIRMAGRAAARVAGDGYAGRPYVGARLEERGFPGIAFSDGPRGVVLGSGTCFPVSMARGASWDVDLEERIGNAIGKELRACGATLFGGVNVNLLRHPAWGRAQETYGEDPVHVGEMGAALARGVQSNAMACVKHFALNSIENARFTVDVRADERTLHEVYLPHFKRVVQEGVACVMSAYNSVNGEWCGENHTLLTEILRDEWGFRGYVISDWIFGLRNPVKSVLAGLDIEMPFRQQRMQHVPRALDEGELLEDDIAAPVQHVVETLLRFDSILSKAAPGPSVIACDAHRALAYESATKSIVLLKNDDVGGTPALPLEGESLRRVAVLGRLAAVPNLGDRGSSNVIPRSFVTPLDGLREALPGVDVAHDDGSDSARAAAVARDADVAIVVVGCTFEDEGEYIVAQPKLLLNHAPPRPDRTPDAPPRLARKGAERPQPETPGFATGGDRRSLDLSTEHQELVHAVAGANPRTVVALMGGSAIMVEGWHAEVPAILMLWYPGMEGGRAFADVLLGRVNPTGRLPFVVPRSADHLPLFDSGATTITYGLLHGQWLLDRDGHEPRYPFGWGLSYTAPPRIADVSVAVTEAGLVLMVQLANETASDATEVVQAFAALSSSRYERPQQRVVGFARTVLAASGSATVPIVVPFERLAIRVDGAWLLEGGEYEVTVGHRAHDPAAVSINVALKERVLPRS